MKPEVIFEDERVFNDTQLITFRLPVKTLNTYKELAKNTGKELSEIIQNVLEQGGKTIQAANIILDENNKKD